MSTTRVPAETPVVTEVTRLHAIPVWAVATPETVAEVQDALRRSTGPVSTTSNHVPSIAVTWSSGRQTGGGRPAR